MPFDYENIKISVCMVWYIIAEEENNKTINQLISKLLRTREKRKDRSVENTKQHTHDKSVHTNTTRCTLLFIEQYERTEDKEDVSMQTSLCYLLDHLCN